MWVGWSPCEFGAPEIDPKRPYGNSYVVGDIHEILTGVSEYEVSDELSTQYEKLHKETETALKLFYVHSSLKLDVIGKLIRMVITGKKFHKIIILRLMIIFITLFRT